MGANYRLPPTARTLIADLLTNEARTIEAKRDGNVAALVPLALERQQIFAAVTEAYPQLTAERIDEIVYSDRNKELVRNIVDNRINIVHGGYVFDTTKDD